ncbi:hypothetical protein, partial [Burkholderia gladioli]|uniref:hypothetical protein n=1 Tax=Burkholderia gladioli TaxID=28095 RepID=UPI001ABAD686
NAAECVRRVLFVISSVPFQHYRWLRPRALHLADCPNSRGHLYRAVCDLDNHSHRGDVKVAELDFVRDVANGGAPDVARHQRTKSVSEDGVPPDCNEINRTHNTSPQSQILVRSTN